MKHLNLILALLIVLLALSCSKSDNKEGLENINLNYDSLLVKSIVNLTPDHRVVKLIGWELDKEASAQKENMLYFNNIKHAGMLSSILLNDKKLADYLQETRKTFAGLEMLSEDIFTFSDKTYHQFILKSEGFIVLKAIVEIDKTHYIDTNFIIVESKYPELAKMIDTYLASIAILNQ